MSIPAADPAPRTIATATWNNQIVQTTATVKSDGSVSVQVGHFGTTYNSPNATPLPPAELDTFEADLTAAAKAPLKQVSGTEVTSFGSQSGTFVSNAATGDAVIKAVQRSTPGKADILQVRDVPETREALQILGTHLGGPFQTTDINGVATTLVPGLMPAAPEQG